MRKVLLIGNGAREHAIAEALKRSKRSVELYVVGAAHNPGILELANEYIISDLCDLNAIQDFAVKVRPFFALVGPEAPIAAGVVDMLLENEIHSASPFKTVGRLESSKSFARALLEKYRIPGNPRFKVFYDEGGLPQFFDELGENFVVKADGLKAGKGVKVSGDHLNGIAEGLAYARECLADVGRVVIEEKLVGQEFSLMSFCDGMHVCNMPVIQDHKRAYEGDKGPNTGGMGSYSDADHSLPFLRDEDVAAASEITKRVASALFEETGTLFKGVMYGGFMATKDGVRLIEYNARFGDPEAMNVLPILKTDFVDVCEAIINGTLADLAVEFENKATVCKYVVPEGYPDNPLKGAKIEIADGASAKGAKVEIAGMPGSSTGSVSAGVRRYYASVDAREDGLYLNGSRAVGFVGIADTIAEAESLAERAAGQVHGPVFHRKDIGTAALIQQRVDMMNELRG